jgi:hypothetical protein
MECYRFLSRRYWYYFSGTEFPKFEIFQNFQSLKASPKHQCSANYETFGVHFAHVITLNGLPCVLPVVFHHGLRHFGHIIIRERPLFQVPID